MKDLTKLNIVVIIPARGGSKGIPNKNIIDLCGHPLISWSINQANNSNYVSSVWVTSDDENILNISLKYGAKVIKRPKCLASDTSSSESAWIHSIDYLVSQKIEVDLIVGLQATSPIRGINDIDNAIFKYFQNDYDSLLSVAELEDYFIWGINSDKEFAPLNYDTSARKPRQQISKSFLENGSIYIFKPSLLKKTKNRLAGKVGMYLMEKHKSFQIDGEEDLKICSGLIKEFKIRQ